MFFQVGEAHEECKHGGLDAWWAQFRRKDEERLRCHLIYDIGERLLAK